MSGYNFDFNIVRQPFMPFGEHVGKAIETAADAIKSGAKTLASDAEAVRAARLGLHRLASLTNSNGEALAAIDVICVTLERQETALRKLAAKRKAGHPGPKLSALEKKARIVFVLKWLQELKNEPLNAAKARKEVTKCLPGGEKQLKSATDAFIKRKATYNRTEESKARHQQALDNVKYEVWDEFYRTWREPIVEVGSDSHANIRYTKNWQERDHLDCTASDVIDWLNRGLSSDDT